MERKEKGSPRDQEPKGLDKVPVFERRGAPIRELSFGREVTKQAESYLAVADKDKLQRARDFFAALAKPRREAAPGPQPAEQRTADLQPPMAEVIAELEELLALPEPPPAAQHVSEFWRAMAELEELLAGLEGKVTEAKNAFREVMRVYSELPERPAARAGNLSKVDKLRQSRGGGQFRLGR